MYLTTIIDLVRAEFRKYEIGGASKLEIASIEPMQLWLSHIELGYAAHLVKGERVRKSGAYVTRFARRYVVIERPEGEPLVHEMGPERGGDSAVLAAVVASIHNDIDAARVEAARLDAIGMEQARAR